MNDHLIRFTDRFDRWARAGGADRRDLLDPLLPVVESQPAVPSGAAGAVAPAAWLLIRAHSVGLPVDRDGFMDPSLALSATRRFGWSVLHRGPECSGGMTEIEVLHVHLVRRGFMTTLGGRSFAPRWARRLAAHPEPLWRALADTLFDPADPFGALPELAWASFLQTDDLGGLEVRGLLRAVLEAEGVTEGWNDEQLEDLAEHSAAGMAWISTLGRALGMFEDFDPQAEVRGHLTNVGRATAVRALRTRILRGDSITGLYGARTPSAN